MPIRQDKTKMWSDCDRCGEFAQCDEEGICTQCRAEEEDDSEQEGEGKATTSEKDEGEAAYSCSSPEHKAQEQA